jgi:hypothetical protein
MGKAKIRKKIDGYKKQLRKHIDKFKEAEKRGAVESMNYMAKEMRNYMQRLDKLNKKTLAKRKQKRK